MGPYSNTNISGIQYEKSLLPKKPCIHKEFSERIAKESKCVFDISETIPYDKRGSCGIPNRTDEKAGVRS
jgi:hypothetical protein